MSAAIAIEALEQRAFAEADTLLDPPRPPSADNHDTVVESPDVVGLPEDDPTLHDTPDLEPRLSRETAELVAQYRFRRFQGHQAGCQCQSRGDYVGCRDLRSRLLAAGFWDVLYEAP